MNQVTRERLFGFHHAFDDRVTVVLTLTALVLFLVAPLLIFIATRAANSTSDKRKELWDRYRSWIWLALFGPSWPWPRLAFFVTGNMLASPGYFGNEQSVSSWSSAFS